MPPINSVLFAQNFADRINDLGSTSFSATNIDPQELVRARLIATASGTITFTGSVAEADLIRPAHNTVVYANPAGPGGVPPAESSNVTVSEILIATPAVTLTVNPAGP